MVTKRLLPGLVACALAACASAPPAPATPERIVVTVIIVVTATLPPATATAASPRPTATALPPTPTPRAPRSNTPAPSSTRNTATPTAPPLPTSTPAPAPSATVASAERNPDGCLKYQFADRYIGQQDCVSGTVVGTYDAGNAFFINYSEDRTAFYGVSFDLRWENLAGRCVRLRGLIETYRGRPQIIIREASQLELCD